jgi:putative intracellular protease/amidase
MASPGAAAAGRVLICMADNGQDPTECAVPWKILTDAGFTVDFATEKGDVPSADQLLVKNSLFKMVLGPKQSWTDIYHQMTDSPPFKSPKSWSADDFSLLPYDAVIFPGGHDKPIRQYLESKSLHDHLKQYWPLTKRNSEPSDSNSGPRRVVGAICHGVLVPTFAGLLHDVETTTLPQWLEGTGQAIGALWGRGQYYRTYDKWTWQGVVNALKDPSQYKKGPMGPGAFAHTDPTYAYVSARWPADAELFAQKIIEEVQVAKKEHAAVPVEAPSS